MTMLLAALDQTIVLPTITMTWVVSTSCPGGRRMPAGCTAGSSGQTLRSWPQTIAAVIVAIFVAHPRWPGLSQSMAQLIGTRAQGIGGGDCWLAVIADIVSPRERGKYMGLFGAVFRGRERH